MDRRTIPQALLSLFDIASEGLWFMSHNNVVQLYNDTFFSQFSLSLESPTLDDWLALVHPADQDRLNHVVKKYKRLRTSDRMTIRYRVLNSRGRYLWIESTTARIEYQGRFALTGSHKDVSDEVFLNQYLMHGEKYDIETGLLNRSQFLRQAVNLSENDWILVCCVTQLHQFRRFVNYDLLAQMSSTITSILDTILGFRYALYRISSDVYVVTIEQALDTGSALALMNQIKTSFRKSQSPSINETLTSRLGLAALPVRNLDIGNPLEKIFNLSEYTRLVKSPVTYTGESQCDIHRHFVILDTLGQAIEARQIKIELQPIVNAANNNLESFEALARWSHPDLGPILPSEFIPACERLGCIHALGLLVLEEACNFLVLFDELHEVRPSINVNVSALQLLEETFVQDVCYVVARFGLSPERVVLEVTESYLLDENSTITSVLEALDARGFKLSIDDFGAGMSAITSLFRLPLYQLKLDRALIQEAMRNDACLTLVNNLCELGLKLNLTIVAEGVEASSTLEELIRVGVPYLQGYCLYKPSPPEYWLR